METTTYHSNLNRLSCWTGSIPFSSPTHPIQSMKTTLLLSLCLFPMVASVVSCREKGPAEKAGESVDKAVEKAKDTVDPKGPVEKAGKKVDNALGK